MKKRNIIVILVLTISLAVLLPLLQKNTEIVSSFLEEFKKTNFLIQGKSFGLFVRPSDQYYVYFEDWYGEKLLFSPEYTSGLDSLMKISESPFMPKSIYNKAEKLRLHLLIMNVKDEDLNKFATVTAIGQPLIGTKFGCPNNQDMTLFEFLNIIDDLKFEIKNWISKHSNYSPDLNI